MKKNCNLGLCLLPSSPSSSSCSSSSSDYGRPRRPMMEESSVSPQQLTIFYNGRICVCNVTEFQARAILMMARREMEERMSPTTANLQNSHQPGSPSLASTAAGLSMKRSLQRFLQKRRDRIQAASPYHH